MNFPKAKILCAYSSSFNPEWPKLPNFSWTWPNALMPNN